MMMMMMMMITHFQSVCRASRPSASARPTARSTVMPNAWRISTTTAPRKSWSDWSGGSATRRAGTVNRTAVAFTVGCIFIITSPNQLQSHIINWRERFTITYILYKDMFLNERKIIMNGEQRLDNTVCAYVYALFQNQPTRTVNWRKRSRKWRSFGDSAIFLSSQFSWSHVHA